MSPGATFDRVYLALKTQLMSGRFRPGEHLEPGAIGEELNASITPVRDALHRLAGERMVEAPRHDGFRVPAPTEFEIRDLYEWNRALIDLAVRARPRARSRRTESRPDPGSGANLSSPRSVAELFESLVRRSQSNEHLAAVRSLNERLATLHLAEQSLFPDHDEEVEALHAALGEEDIRPLRKQLRTYHRRRQRHAGQLLMILRGDREN